MKQATKSAQTGEVTTTVASTVMRVAELDRSVDFYRDVNFCRVSPARTGHCATVDTGRVSGLSALDGPSAGGLRLALSVSIPDVGHRQQDELERSDHPAAKPTIRPPMHTPRTGLTFVEVPRPRPWRGHRRLSQPEPALPSR